MTNTEKIVDLITQKGPQTIDQVAKSLFGGKKTCAYTSTSQAKKAGAIVKAGKTYALPGASQPAEAIQTALATQDSMLTAIETATTSMTSVVGLQRTLLRNICDRIHRIEDAIRVNPENIQAIKDDIQKMSREMEIKRPVVDVRLQARKLKATRIDYILDGMTGGIKTLCPEGMMKGVSSPDCQKCRHFVCMADDTAAIYCTYKNDLKNGEVDE